MNSNPRIKLSDSLLDSATKLSEGNPGAVNVLLLLVAKTEEIDPDAALGPYAHLLNLDSLGIYGSRIWSLYKDVCGENIATTMAVVRAVQLDKLSEHTLDHAIDNRGEGINTEEIVAIIQEELPKYGRKQPGYEA